MIIITRKFFKKNPPWFKDIYTQILQNVFKCLDKVYQNVFQRMKKDAAPGFPKFQKHGQWNSIIYPQYLIFPSSHIAVPKVCSAKTDYHRQIPKNLKKIDIPQVLCLKCG